MNLLRSFAILAASLSSGQARIPARKLEGPPATSGVVTRDDVPHAFWVGDPDTGLVALVGWTLAEWCEARENEEEYEFDLSMQMIALTGQDQVNQVLLRRGNDLTAEVWPIGVYEPPRFFSQSCPEVLSGDVASIATGTARVTNNDNDLEARETKGPRKNSYGFRAQGELEDEGGDKYRLNVVVKKLFDANESDEGTAIVEKVTLKAQGKV